MFDRLYEAAILKHFEEERQMLFLMGPRQVGKTTSARRVGERWGEHHYMSWDDPGNRRIVLAGPEAIAEALALERIRTRPPLLILDEIHKLRDWKDLLKGLFDVWGERVKILVTGSARLGAFRAGGDSLMGRYFSYRMHPLSLAELLRPELAEAVPSGPSASSGGVELTTLLARGGHPEPLSRDDDRFSRRWRNLRDQQLLREDVRDLTRIQDLGQLQVLAELLRQAAGQLTNMSSLARQIRVSVDTVRRWLETLEALYYCFPVRPWHRNVRRSLRKEPKFYPWDWSQVPAPGRRAENLVAAALLKACHFWTDHGLGDFALHFLRDKQGREVDFLVSRDDEPWLLVEVKLTAGRKVSDALRYFQTETGAPLAVQVGFDLEPEAVDPFAAPSPAIVPAATFLSCLV